MEREYWERKERRNVGKEEQREVRREGWKVREGCGEERREEERERKGKGCETGGGRRGRDRCHACCHFLLPTLALLSLLEEEEEEEEEGFTRGFCIWDSG